jgi:predicted acetyltransferase
LVDQEVKVAGGEFFIMKKYPKRGMGSAAARIIFNIHFGQWQVRQMTTNFIAQSF